MAKMRERVALLTRPAVKRAPSQAPMTEAIEVTITVGQSNVAVAEVGLAKAENDGQRDGHRVRRGGQAGAVADEGQGRHEEEARADAQEAGEDGDGTAAPAAFARAASVISATTSVDAPFGSAMRTARKTRTPT